MMIIKVQKIKSEIYEIHKYAWEDLCKTRNENANSYSEMVEMLQEEGELVADSKTLEEEIVISQASFSVVEE